MPIFLLVLPALFQNFYVNLLKFEAHSRPYLILLSFCMFLLQFQLPRSSIRQLASSESTFVFLISQALFAQFYTHTSAFNALCAKAKVNLQGHTHIGLPLRQSWESLAFVARDTSRWPFLGPDSKWGWNQKESGDSSESNLTKRLDLHSKLPKPVQVCPTLAN